MKLEGKRVLVTGADGFIGSHLTEELVRQGHEVRALILYNSFNSWGWLDSLPADTLNSVNVTAGDIRDSHSVKEAMRDCDVVLHLAALVSIPYSYQCPYAYVDTNITGTLNILQAARELNIERVVHTSTSEVYGTARFAPMTEEHPLYGQSPYSATKIGADQLALSYHLSFETPVAVIRPFNTYGPRQSTRAVIPTIITQIASGAKTVSLGALKPTRDFSFVSDIVQGFLAVATADECIGQVTNIGSGYEISIENIADLIATIMNADVEFVSNEQRLRPTNSEVERLVACIEKANRITDWNPAYTGQGGLHRGIAETAAWYCDKENLKLYRPDLYNI